MRKKKKERRKRGKGMRKRRKKMGRRKRKVGEGWQRGEGRGGAYKVKEVKVCGGSGERGEEG